MGEWIWQNLTRVIGSITGGKPGEVGWSRAVGAANAVSSSAAPATPVGGGQFGPNAGGAHAMPPTIPGEGVDLATWNAYLKSHEPPERAAGVRWGPY
jgi:hypothetical protein